MSSCTIGNDSRFWVNLNGTHILNHGPMPIHELLLIYNKIHGNIGGEHSETFMAIWQSNINEFNNKNGPIFLCCVSFILPVMHFHCYTIELTYARLQVKTAWRKSWSFNIHSLRSMTLGKSLQNEGIHIVYVEEKRNINVKIL